MQFGISKKVSAFIVTLLCVVSFFAGMYFQKTANPNKKVDLKAIALFDSISISDVIFESDGVLFNVSYNVNDDSSYLINLGLVKSKCQATISGKVYIGEEYSEFELLPLNEKTTFDASNPKDFKLKLKYGDELDIIGKEYISKNCKNVYVDFNFSDSAFGTTCMYDLFQQ